MSNTQTLIDHYLTNGKYDPNKSESRKAHIISMQSSKTTRNAFIPQAISAVQGMRLKLNNIVRVGDAQVEELQDIATNAQYLQEKTKWNAGFFRYRRKRIPIKS